MILWKTWNNWGLRSRHAASPIRRAEKGDTAGKDSTNTAAYHDLDTLITIIQSNAIDSIGASGLTSLQTMAGRTSIAATRAQNLLRNYYGMRFEHYPVISNTSGDRMMRVAQQKSTKPNAQNNVKVFPNPAGNYVTFSFSSVDASTELYLYIYSTTGVSMYQSKLDQVIGQQVVMVNSWINGIYGYSIRGTNNKLGSGTFIVSH